MIPEAPASRSLLLHPPPKSLTARPAPLGQNGYDPPLAFQNPKGKCETLVSSAALKDT